LNLAFLTGKTQPADGRPPPVWRRLFHLSFGSSIPIAGIFAPDYGMAAAMAVVSAGGLGLDLLRFRLSWLNRQFVRWLVPLLKREEERRITGATYMVIAALFAFLLFGSPVAVPALLFLSLGDPAAAVVGRRAPGPRIRGKSPIGTAAFIAVAFLVTGVLAGTGAVDYHWGLLVGAAVAGLAELASVPPDDNLAVPLAAGAAMYILGV
jgi:dolichol kinase